MVRRRTSADPFPTVAPVTATAGCYLLSRDTLSWRIEVSSDTLRGSGRIMPESIAGWLGVTPGNQRVLAAEGGTVRMTWPLTSANGPAIGSIRYMADRVSAQAGDQLLLTIRRDQGTIACSRVDAVAVAASHGFERLALLTGIPNGDGEAAFLHRLGTALGVRGTRAAVSAELRQRGEAALASLVPAETASPDLDLAIDALKDLF